MNIELVTDDAAIAVKIIDIALETADDFPIMISIRKRDGRYVCDIAHPTEFEPTS